MHSPKILWLEDHPSTVRLLREEFDRSFQLEVVPGIDGLARILGEDSARYEAVLLDMELADGKTGFDALQICKEAGASAPVLILSNDESLHTRIKMLSLGVDDYLWKAMDPEEMMIRIRNAIQRKSVRAGVSGFELQGLSLDPVRVQVKVQGKDVDFSRIEFHLLMLLLQNHPSPVTIESLRRNVWRLPVLETGTIHTFVWKMNKKLQSWSMRLKKSGSEVGLALKDL